MPETITPEEAMERFKQFCLSKHGYDDYFDDLDWYDLSIGFFTALGQSAEIVEDLACEARYKHEYWT